MKTFKFSLVFRTHENTDVVITLDENIYGICSKRVNILYMFLWRNKKIIWILLLSGAMSHCLLRSFGIYRIRTLKLFTNFSWNLRSFWLCLMMFLKTAGWVANSVDPDQMPCSLNIFFMPLPFLMGGCADGYSITAGRTYVCPVLRM